MSADKPVKVNPLRPVSARRKLDELAAELIRDAEHLQSRIKEMLTIFPGAAELIETESALEELREGAREFLESKKGGTDAT